MKLDADVYEKVSGSISMMVTFLELVITADMRICA